jgi:hypothetical protein
LTTKLVPLPNGAGTHDGCAETDSGNAISALSHHRTRTTSASFVERVGCNRFRE